MRGYWLAGLLLLAATPALSLNLAGVEVAPLIRAPEHTRPWSLQGSALIHRSFIPFFGLALHAPSEAGRSADLSDGATPLQITLVWYTPELPRAQVQEYFRKQFEHAADAETLSRIEPRLSKFLEILPKARRGERMTFFYTPDGGTQVEVEGGGRGHFAGIEFNRALLSLWLGDTADAEVREGLRTPPANETASVP